MDSSSHIGTVGTLVPVGVGWCQQLRDKLWALEASKQEVLGGWELFTDKARCRVVLVKGAGP